MAGWFFIFNWSTGGQAGCDFKMVFQEYGFGFWLRLFACFTLQRKDQKQSEKIEYYMNSE